MYTEHFLLPLSNMLFHAQIPTLSSDCHSQCQCQGISPRYHASLLLLSPSSVTVSLVHLLTFTHQPCPLSFPGVLMADPFALAAERVIAVFLVFFIKMQVENHALDWTEGQPWLGWTEGLILSKSVHQVWPTAHHFAVGSHQLRT